MRKYILILASLFLSLFIAGQVSAASVMVESEESAQVYLLDFDVLALHMKLTAEDDVLQTITFAQNGNAREDIEFHTLKLWVDRGEPGFQGWGYDQELAIADNDASHWVFDDLGYELNGEESFFISLETGTNIDQKTSQFIIDQPGDHNNDGVWQPGEMGIYFDSGVVTTYNGSLGSNTIFFQDPNVDQSAPKAMIENISVDSENRTAFYLSNEEMTIEGMARDRNSSIVTHLELFVGDQINVPVEFNQGSPVNWSATFTPPMGLNDFDVRIMSQDSGGRQYTSARYYIHVDNREPDPSKTVVSLSKSSVLADETDTLFIQADLFDANGDVMLNRDLQFVFDKDNQPFAEVSASTDATGRATLSETFGLAGNYVVTVLLGTTQLGQASFTATEMAEQPENDQFPGIVPGDLIKASLDAVYYYSSLGTRHVFVKQSVYASWYGNDFSAVKTVSDELLAQIPLGDPVGYRPGTMITAPSINEVYLVTRGQVLRHLPSENFAANLFGSAWNTMIFDLQESLLFAYTISNPFAESESVNLPALQDSSITIDDELQLKQ